MLIAATAWNGLLYVPKALYLAGGAGAIAAGIRVSEWLLPTGMATEYCR